MQIQHAGQTSNKGHLCYKNIRLWTNLSLPLQHMIYFIIILSKYLFFSSLPFLCLAHSWHNLNSNYHFFCLSHVRVCATKLVFMFPLMWQAHIKTIYQGHILCYVGILWECSRQIAMICKMSPHWKSKSQSASILLDITTKS